MTDYTELKRLAEAATPGPWNSDNSHHEGSINAADRHIGMVSMYARRPNDIIENFSNQAFIAAANPAAILTLISENSRLNDGAHMRAINSLRQDCRDLKSERDQLKAESAGLQTGYKAYEQVNAELRAENEALRSEVETLQGTTGAAMFLTLSGELAKLRWALKTIREESHDIGACECAADALAGAATAFEADRAAREIYESWAGQDGYVPWVAGGNSLKQDEARRLARAALGQGEQS